MFILIVTAISVCLLPASYYSSEVGSSGSALGSSSAKAEARVHMDAAQNIQGGHSMFKLNEGREPVNIGELSKSGMYLAYTPDGWALGKDSSGTSVAYARMMISDGSYDSVTEDVCDMINDEGAGVIVCKSVASSVYMADILTGFDPVNNYEADDYAIIYKAL